jgi:hypothetical protein
MQTPCNRTKCPGLAVEGNDPISDAAVYVRILVKIVIFRASGVFDSAVIDWECKPEADY